MIPQSEWEWYGHVGHWILGMDCRFHLATVVGDVMISTIGEYVPSSPRERTFYAAKVLGKEASPVLDVQSFVAEFGWLPISSPWLFETLIFRVDKQKRCEASDCNCGAPDVSSWEELAGKRYMVRGDAHRGHLRACTEWADVKRRTR